MRNVARWILFALLAACGGGEPKTTPPSGEPTPVDKPPVGQQTVDPTQTGAVRGVIRLEGAPPAATPVVMQSDAWCKSHHDAPPVDESLVVHDGLVQNAFVWVETGLDAYKFEVPTEKRELDQVGCIFGPRVIGVMAGQPLTALNSDQVLHNVHSKPKVNTGKNIALPSPGSSRDFVFDRPEVMVPIVCDVHPWMRAFVGVVAHPYFAVSAEDGSFAIEALPAGEFTLAIWHETLGEQRRTVQVAAGQSVDLDAFVYQLP